MKKLTFVLFFAAVCFHLGLLFTTTFVDWPEIPLYPWLIHTGLNLYSDVSIAYPPLSVYLFLGYFLLFGFSTVSYQMLTYAIILVTDVCIFWILKRMNVHAVLIFALLLLYSVLQVSFGGNGLWHELLMTPFILLLYLCISAFIHTGRFRLLVYGVCLGTLMVFIKQTSLWTVIGTGLFVCIYHLKSPWSTVRRFCILVSIPLSGILLSILYYASRGSAQDYLFWVFEYPILLTQYTNDYAYMPFFHDVRNSLAIYGVVFLTPFFLIHKKILTEEKIQLLLVLLFGGTALLAAFPRWGFFRLQMSLPFVILFLGYMCVFGLRLKQNKIFVAVSIIVCVVCMYYERKYIRTFFIRDDRQAVTYFSPAALSEASRIATLVGSNSLYIWGSKEYYAMLMNKPPSVLPWQQHFSWMLKAGNLIPTKIQQVEDAKVHYFFLSENEQTLPVEMRTYVKNTYRRIVEFESGSSLWKRKSEEQ